MKDDDMRCVILGRTSKSASWDMIIICSSKSSAWRFAHSVMEQEERLGNKRQECIVVLEEDLDKKKIIPIKPPKDFDLKYPEIIPTEPAEVAPKAVRKISPWMMPPEPTRTVQLGAETPKQQESPPVKLSGYQPKKCPYCTSDVPSNGAAQFSHLKKHVNELVSRKVLTVEQAAAIRSTKLTEEMQKVFTEAYRTDPVPA